MTRVYGDLVLEDNANIIKQNGTPLIPPAYNIEYYESSVWFYAFTNITDPIPFATISTQMAVTNNKTLETITINFTPALLPSKAGGYGGKTFALALTPELRLGHYNSPIVSTVIATDIALNRTTTTSLKWTTSTPTPLLLLMSSVDTLPGDTTTAASVQVAIPSITYRY